MAQATLNTVSEFSSTRQKVELNMRLLAHKCSMRAYAHRSNLEIVQPLTL